MDKEHLKGAGKQAEGAVKDAVGGLTGNARLQAEGKADKLEGKAREKLGDVKDAVRDLKR
ncbi:MAG TPA: CsbD family protein [Hyphomicrobiales bacterium]|nr:CsbD family protein [Hyphomicrobiales bacterium]